MLEHLTGSRSPWTLIDNISIAAITQGGGEFQDHRHLIGGRLPS